MANKKFPKNKPITIPIQKYNIRREFKNIILREYNGIGLKMLLNIQPTEFSKKYKVLLQYDSVQKRPQVYIDIKPISIILTTLMARIYTGKENVYELIEKFSKEYVLYLERDENGNVLIQNPVNKNENFADKWKIYPERQEAFFNWVENLKYDLITNNFMIFDDITEKTNYLKKVFGNKTITNVFEKRNSSMSERYIDRKNIATITANKTDTKVKEHTFFGK